jgi:DNA-binding transcriptional LysR family regulator
MELRHLRYFVGVAEDMNFSRAAARLHVAQSALSRQIQDLEGEIGVQLFVRDKRGIVLTAAGKVFLGEARRLVAQSQQAIETARRAARGEVGRLDLGYIGALSDGLIPRLMRKFRAQFPGVEVKLHALRPARQVEALRRDEIQLGFIGLPSGDAEAMLNFEVFRRDRMVVALPAGHPLTARRAVKLADLAAERFIFLSRAGTPVYYDWLMRLCHDAGFHPNIVQEVETGQTMVELVAAGSGVALFPETAQRQLHGDMSFHSLAGNVPRYEHAVAWRRGDTSPALQAFLEMLRREVAERRTARPPNLAR